MSATTERRRPSLRSRIVVGAVLLAALPPAALALAVWVVGSDVARDAVASSLRRDRLIETLLRETRAEALTLVARHVASDSAFAGYVAEATRGVDPSVGALSLVDLLDERRAEFGLDFALVLDGDGRPVVPGGMPVAWAVRADDPLVRRAVDELQPVGGIRSLDTGPHQLAIVPIAKDRELLGFLAAGLALDERLVTEIRSVVGGEVVFATLAAGAVPVATASSLDPARTAEVLHALGARSFADRPHDRDEATVIEVGGRRLAAGVDLLGGGTAGEPSTAIVSLVSVDEALAPYRRLRRVIAVAGAAAVLAGLGAAVGFGRRALEPVRALARSAEAAGAGDYTRRLDEPREGELARMARAFNRLLADLRERREVADLVRRIARNLPDDALEAAVVGAPDAAGAGDDPAGPTATLAPGVPPGGGAAPGIAAGRVLAGRWEIVSVLGSGGMGVVLKARDLRVGETVALKFLRGGPAGGGDERRLVEEIRTARRITHPHVLRTFDLGEADGVPFLTMEYVRGLALDALIARAGALPPAAGLFLVRQLCEGLAAAHAAGIVHRDVKPANVIVETDGTAKLMDFGLAVPQFGPGAAARPAGTPAYMAPEVLAGGEPDRRADLYALGALIVDVLDGRPAFTGRRLDELAAAKREPEAALAGRNLPAGVREVVRRCLDPDPARRPPDAAALARALDAVDL